MFLYSAAAVLKLSMAFLIPSTPSCNSARKRAHPAGLAYLPLQPSPLSYNTFNCSDLPFYTDDAMNVDGAASTSKTPSSPTSSGSSSFVFSSSPLKQSHSTFSQSRQDERRRAYKSTISQRTTSASRQSYASNATTIHASSSSSPYHPSRTTGPRSSPAAFGAHDRPHFRFIEETARRARSQRASIVDSRRNGLGGDLVRNNETDEELANLRREHLRDERSRYGRARDDLSSDEIIMQRLAQDEQATEEMSPGRLILLWLAAGLRCMTRRRHTSGSNTRNGGTTRESIRRSPGRTAFCVCRRCRPHC